MRNLIVRGLLFTVAALGCLPVDAGYVKGHTRKDGTYVAPHYRADPVRTKSAAPKATAAPKANGVRLPKSYEVYQQRQTQGPRTFSKGMKQRKYSEQGGKCPHCGKQCTYGEMEGDHVVPYSKGGKTEYSNLQMLCAPCNRSKGNRYSY